MPRPIVIIMSLVAPLATLDRVDLESHSAAMTDAPETATVLTPRYDANGLITAVLSDARDNALLMVAHMNADALDRTLATGEAWFWSRSRQRLWKKGESSGHVMRVQEVRVDCDQDCLWLLVDPVGPACHTCEGSCFYRVVRADGVLTKIT
jgi:phosphoribosyl-AMP cyclohydrolase